MEGPVIKILRQFPSEQKEKEILTEEPFKEEKDFRLSPEFSSIPDIFFDEILFEFRLGRGEILVLLYLYRKVWCRPNIYKNYGISPIMKYETMANDLEMSTGVLIDTLKKLESQGLVESIRSGQYFVRRFILEKWDRNFQYNYSDE